MKWVLFALAVVVYGLAILAAILFFKVEDQGAKAGKRIVFVLGGLSTSSVVYSLFVTQQIQFHSAIIAVCLYVISLTLLAWTLLYAAHQSMGFLGTATPPRTILTKGPYAWVRHPFYVSYMLGWLAGFAATLSAETLWPCVVMIPLYVVAALSEERRMLESPLADTYRLYASRVARFVPHLV